MSTLAPERPRSFAWKAASILLGFCLIFYWKILFTNQAIFPWDAPDQFYPLHAFVHEDLRHLRLPLWDPYVLSGHPIIGDVLAQIFYPVNWLYVLLWPHAPLPYRLVEIVEILHFFLAGMFMYWLARDFVESELAALVAGLLFMSSGAMVAHTQHLPLISSVAWYPLVFLMARRAFLQKKFFYVVCAGALFGIQILAGHWQHSVYLGLFLFLYYAYEACLGPLRRELWPFWMMALAMIAAVGAALALVQIVPSYELGNQSVRAFVNYMEVSVGNHPRFLLTSFLPNYLGGINGFPFRYPVDLSYSYIFLTVPGVLLALCGLADTIRRRNYFWLGTLLLFTELSFGAEGHLAGALYHIPVLNLFRTMATFFDLSNFVICLLAAVGADWLFRVEISRRGKKKLLAALAILILVGLVGAIPGVATAQIPGWRHALAALLVFSCIVLARFRGWLNTKPVLAILLAVVGFELWFYSSNQMFNSSPENPATFLSADYAVGRKESLNFLRSDAANDFRVAALGEYQWSGNGWNVWRIPGVTGVNPLIVRRYDAFMRLLSHVTTVRIPLSGEDHNFRSPLADLLGVKYLVLADPGREASLGLGAGSKFQRTFDDFDWWRIYRNDHSFHHAWFYPRAYVLPSTEHVNELLNSSWFDPRRALLLEGDEIPQEASQRAEELTAIPLYPGSEANHLSGGKRVNDPYCAQPVSMIGGWGRRGDRMEFAVPPSAPPGRYRLLLRYTANELAMSSPGLERLSERYPWYRTALPTTPRLEVTLEGVGEGAGQAVAPISASLPRTLGWPCHEARPADLGEWNIPAGETRISISSLEDSTVDVYSVMLVRLPDSEPPDAGKFSFHDFVVSENQISFKGEVSQDGFVLLNEVYYPGWEATVDGTPSRIVPADGVFRALYVTAGPHRIDFQFRPRYLYLGMMVSLLTLAALLVYFGAHWRERIAVNSSPRQY